MTRTFFWLALATCLCAMVWMPEPGSSDCVNTCYASQCWQAKQGSDEFFYRSETTTPCYEWMRNPSSSGLACVGTNNLTERRVTGVPLCDDWGNAEFRPASECNTNITGPDGFTCCQTCSTNP